MLGKTFFLPNIITVKRTFRKTKKKKETTRHSTAVFSLLRVLAKEAHAPGHKNRLPNGL